MKRHIQVLGFGLRCMSLLLGIILLASCSLLNPTPEAEVETPERGRPTLTVVPPTEPPPDAGEEVRLTADRDGVTAIQPDGASQPLPAPEEAFLPVGGGVDVDEVGRAILRFADLLTVEVLRDGGLEIQTLDVQEQSAFITVLQNGGALLNDFDPQEEIERRFTVQTEFATITATGTRFLLAREAGSPLEWIVGLDSEAGDLQVTADGVTKDVVTGQARWIAPIDEPSPGISADMGSVQAWIGSLQTGDVVEEIGETLWAQADVLLNTGVLAALPEVGQPAPLGDINLTLLPGGEYAFEDCNGDAIPDIAIVGGELELDFRAVLNRVRAVDVTVFKRGGGGSLQGLDPAREPIEDRGIPAAASQVEVLSLRSDAPFHYASLRLENGCFLGVSLTPPGDEGESGLPRSPVGEADAVIIDTPEDGASDVVNGFTLAGRTTLSPDEAEGALTLAVETVDGEVIQRSVLTLREWNADLGVSTFNRELYVDAALPADIRIQVRYESRDNARVVAEDSIFLFPLNADPAVDVRPPTHGRLTALRVGPGGHDVGVQIDGGEKEWLALQEIDPKAPVSSFTIVYDRGCDRRYPDAPNQPDLGARVALAYDQQFLYVNFTVLDDGYEGFLGEGELFFNGDAPQILLDLDLAGDFAENRLSPDDIQLDFLPGREAPGDAPLVAFWQLDEVTSTVLPDALIDSRWVGLGYFLEAAIPWDVLGVDPQPGQTFGFAASVSDNDTPGTDVQECMISTAPERNWQDPTTWGTLILEP